MESFHEAGTELGVFEDADASLLARLESAATWKPRLLDRPKSADARDDADALREEARRHVPKLEDSAFLVRKARPERDALRS